MNFKELMDEFLDVKRGLWEKETRNYIITQYNNDIDPEIGSMPIETIKPTHVVSLLKKIEGQGHTHKAHRSRERIEQVYRYAIACGYCENNPAAFVIDALKPHKVKGLAYLPISEFPDFLRAFRDEGGLSKTHYDAWMLILYTSKRRGEVTFAEWTEFDFENALWKIPAHRTKTNKVHVTPLSVQALKLLKRRFEQHRNKYVFEHRKREDRPMNRWMIWQAVRRTKYVGKMTLHGVRKVFSTFAHESGLWSIDAIETQLSHDIPGVRGIYNRAVYLDERRRMVQWWADYIDNWLIDKKDTS